MEQNRIIQFESITQVIQEKGYFVFLANDALYATNGIDVVTWDSAQLVGKVEEVFALIPKWIKFFKSSLITNKDQTLKRNAPMINPTQSRVVKMNISYQGDLENANKQEEEYLVFTKNNQTW
ncbi:hypothetical protein [Spiroplasma alleghenense]|uniref:Uncharacterized protein n=1 Tax=Spiroplasma alleghenense TaxID=216931 RepID=A0A345Z472_9MOLU|nr:hypothetical protein [Spiroplasma alleghenense]AXK51401.1 hypothetical protein SALLE_v1c07310 [Spiroplasma alleghenense]